MNLSTSNFAASATYAYLAALGVTGPDLRLVSPGRVLVEAARGVPAAILAVPSAGAAGPIAVLCGDHFVGFAGEPVKPCRGCGSIAF